MIFTHIWLWHVAGFLVLMDSAQIMWNLQRCEYERLATGRR
jgi:hypothetical protein